MLAYKQALFQCLIGKVKTDEVQQAVERVVKRFQCLIGKVKTGGYVVDRVDPYVFQCLIGKVKTKPANF